MRSEETPLDAAIRGLARGARRLDRVIEAWRPAAWLELDRRIRISIGQGEIERPVHPWMSTGRLPAALRAALRAPAPTGSGLTLALCDPSGLVREAALAHAARHPAVLPLVAIRTTDWVPAVRDRAREVLTAALPGADTGALAVTAPVILRLRKRLRGGTAVALLDAVLRAAPGDDLTLLLRSRDRATRRFAFGIAAERGLLTPADLARTAAYDGDVAVQDVAATAALAAGVPDETLPLLLTARSGRVRSAGVTALRKAGRAAEAEAFLHDRSGMVRACARWVLRQDGRDPLALYRAACADPAAVPARAPLGLAECGDRTADAETLWGLTGHPDPLVRSSAVAGLRTFETAEFARLLPLLDDPSPGVVREAARTLLPWADRVREEEFLRRTGPGRPVHVRVRALLLLRECGSAAYREVAERLVADPDPVLRLRVRRALGREEPLPRPAGARRLWGRREDGSVG
ncbi:HEAT repeat domain-containing protein [Streptomyces sp. NPDC004787]|uniref:HEAT repeat domain-containing protein n=1 Tax=Streptomyces sp. NPDC004787 TaxID=3154291 RepID=UPI0033B47D47